MYVHLSVLLSLKRDIIFQHTVALFHDLICVGSLEVATYCNARRLLVCCNVTLLKISEMCPLVLSEQSFHIVFEVSYSGD
jgi:hypothetical protein